MRPLDKAGSERHGEITRGFAMLMRDRSTAMHAAKPKPRGSGSTLYATAALLAVLVALFAFGAHG